MALTAETVLISREVMSNGIIQVKLAKRITDGVAIISSGWHRFTMVPGMNASDALAAVDANLAQLGFPAIPDDAKTSILGMASQEWTDAIVSAYQASIQ